MDKRIERQNLFFTAIAGRAQIYLFLGKNDHALADIAYALSKDLPYRSIIRIKLLKAEIFLRGKKDFQAAENITSDMIKEDPIKQNNELFTQALNLMGGIKRYAGELDQALVFYERSLELNKNDGLHYNIGIVSSNIASIYHIKGQRGKAIVYLENALAAFIRSGDQFHIEEKKKDLGLMQLEMGNYDIAEDSFLRYLKTARKLGYKKGEAEVHNFLGFLYKMKGDPERALKYRQGYLRLAEEMRDDYLIASAKNSVAIIYQEKELYEKAEILLKESLQLGEKHNHANLVVASILNLITSYTQMKDFKNALTYLRKAVKIITPLNNNNYSFHLFQNYAIYHNGIENPSKAAHYYGLAKEKAEQMNNHKLVITSWVNMISCLEKIHGNRADLEQKQLNAYAGKFDLIEYLRKIQEKD